MTLKLLCARCYMFGDQKWRQLKDKNAIGELGLLCDNDDNVATISFWVRKW